MHCFITGNTSVRGGGIYCKYAAPLIVDCLIAGNTATTDDGGGIYGGGNVHNCTFSQNHSGNTGGAVGSYDDIGYSYIHVYNSILWGDAPNEASYANITYSDVQGGAAGTGNILLDPLFVAPLAGDYRLGGTSPCIDTGSDANVPADLILDLAGYPRIVDGNGDGVAHVDMGAYEYWPGPVLCRGDTDCDGAVGFGDIDYFVAAIPDNEPAWTALYAARHGGQAPPCSFVNCDANGDTHVNFADIDPFVALIPSDCP